MRRSQIFLWFVSVFSAIVLGETTSLPQSGNISLGEYWLIWSKISSTVMPSLDMTAADVIITTEAINTTTPVMDPYTRITTCDDGVEPTPLVTTYSLHNQSLTWNRTSLGTPQSLATVNTTTWSRGSAQPRASPYTSLGFSQRSTSAESLSAGLCCFLSIWVVT